MNVNHAWKKTQESAQRRSDYITRSEHEAIVETRKTEATLFSMQFIQDCAMIALHRAYGFGPERNARFMNALCEVLAEVQNNVNDEIRAEAPGQSRKPRSDRRNELAYTLERIDEELRPIVPPDSWVPRDLRYMGAGIAQGEG